MSKPYDSTLDEASQPGEWAVLSWLLDVGFTVTDHPQGDKGPDIHVARLGKTIEEFIVEVELMGQERTNEVGDLIYATLSVLARRKISTSLPTFIFHVTHDLRHAHIVFDRDFVTTLTQTGQLSSNHRSGEGKKYVPIERVLRVTIGAPLDEPFADINSNRVRDMVAHETDGAKVRRILGPVRPYGMSGVEWRRMTSMLAEGLLPSSSAGPEF